MTEGEQKGCGCVVSPASPGCGVLVFLVLLLSVLMVEHAFHIFEGAFYLLTGLLAVGLVGTGSWWVLKHVLIWYARRMPDEEQEFKKRGD